MQFFVARDFNAIYSKLGKMSLTETLFNVTNSSILEILQFCWIRVFAMVIVINSVIGGANCPITTLHNN